MRRQRKKWRFWFDPAGIALIYWSVGLLWILLSDHLLMQAGVDPVTLTRWQMAKGLLFVTLSALLAGDIAPAGAAGFAASGPRHAGRRPGAGR